jgi:hypothetical protein
MEDPASKRIKLEEAEAAQPPQDTAMPDAGAEAAPQTAREATGAAPGDAPAFAQLLEAGAPAALVAALKAAPRLQRFAVAALDLLTRLVGDEAVLCFLVEGGDAVEAAYRARNPYLGDRRADLFEGLRGKP